MPPQATAATSATASGPGAVLSVNQIIKLLTTPPCSLSTSEGVRAAAKLIPAGFKTTAAFGGIQKSDLTKLEIVEPETVKKILKLSSKAKAKSPAKVKKGSDLDRSLPTAAEQVTVDDFDFKEILYLPTLEIKSLVINKAPILTLWAVIVAERLGFNREEALSLGQC